MAKRKKKSNQSVVAAFAAGIAIVVILIIILVLLYTGETEVPPDKLQPASADPLPENPVPEESVSSGAPAAGAPGAASVSSSVKKPVKNKIVVVIDDVGNNLFQLEPYEGFRGTLTFAVLPGLPFTRAAAERAVSMGAEVLLHLPMESISGAETGPGAVLDRMTDSEIRQRLAGDINQLPEAVGINNHMGSLGTADERVMKEVLAFAKERGLIFLDSLTTSDSVAERLSADTGIRFLKRNYFLDNQCDDGYIHEAFAEGLESAEKRGYVIMIGHIWCTSLAAYLTDHYDDITAAGFEFAGIKDVIRVEYDSSGD